MFVAFRLISASRSHLAVCVRFSARKANYCASCILTASSTDWLSIAHSLSTCSCATVITNACRCSHRRASLSRNSTLQNERFGNAFTQCAPPFQLMDAFSCLALRMTVGSRRSRSRWTERLISAATPRIDGFLEKRQEATVAAEKIVVHCHCLGKKTFQSELFGLPLWESKNYTVANSNPQHNRSCSHTCMFDTDCTARYLRFHAACFARFRNRRLLLPLLCCCCYSQYRA